MNQDFKDLIAALLSGQVEFLIVGAWALACHGHPRATGDLDIWVGASSANAARVVAALASFGAPLRTHAVTESDFARPGFVYQLGVPPRRIDVMTSVSGIEFEASWRDRVEREVDGLRIPFLGRAALIANKRAAGRAKDLADVERLERQPPAG